MSHSITNLRIQRYVVAIGAILLGAKFLAYLITHSNAILTDALESIVNVAAALMGWYSLSLSAKPKDEDHPYGHGKIEYVSAAVEASLILFAGLMIVGKSTYNMFHPKTLEALDTGLYIIVATGAINFAAGFIAERQGHKSGSVALIGSGQHLKSDAYSTAGIVAGLLLILIFHADWLDNAVAIFFGCWIMYMGFKVMRKAVAGIMDEADYGVLAKIISMLNESRRSTWVDLHNMRVIKYGTVWHIDCHLTVPFYFTVQEGHNEVVRIYMLAQKGFQNPAEFYIHTDYCLPPKQCRICSFESCTERQAPFEKKIEWSITNVLSNTKHGTEEA